jgi:hypothetical protein
VAMMRRLTFATGATDSVRDFRSDTLKPRARL